MKYLNIGVKCVNHVKKVFVSYTQIIKKRIKNKLYL